VPRLFRNAPGLFYVGRVHEQVFSSLEVRCQQWGLKNQFGKSALLHRGYTKEVVVSRDKIERNLKLLKVAIEELPDEPSLIMNLGLELVRSGKLEAGIEKYQEALSLLASQPVSLLVPELRETLITQLATHLLAAKKFPEIVHLSRMPFVKSGGVTASQHFVFGLAHMELQQPAEAVGQLRQCLEKRNRPVLSPINSDIHKAGPNHCLAMALSALDQREAAEQAFQSALTDDPQTRPARYDYARFKASQGEPLEALKLLNQLNAEDPSESRVWQFGAQIALSRPELLAFARQWTTTAIQHFPEHAPILLQHAESLLLNGEANAALPFWLRAHSPNSARQLAAIVLCESVAGTNSRTFTADDEALVSQEFNKWYQLLIKAGANSLLHQLNETMENIRPVIPSFVRLWEAAISEANQAVVV
jgi:tetratricopeptide (TPR) repeat protein